MKSLLDTERAPAKTAGEMPLIRASVFDPLAPVDPWIERCRCSDLVALYLHNRPVAVFPASLLDLPSLNQLLFRLRQRPMKSSGLDGCMTLTPPCARGPVIQCRRP